MDNRTDAFTDTLKLYIDNDEWTYNAVLDRAKAILEFGYTYPIIELADFLEDIFDFYCSCNDEAYLLSDMIDLVKNEIDFDGLAEDYINRAKEEAA